MARLWTRRNAHFRPPLVMICCPVPGDDCGLELEGQHIWSRVEFFLSCSCGTQLLSFTSLRHWVKDEGFSQLPSFHAKSQVLEMHTSEKEFQVTHKNAWLMRWEI
jgi:hypothetical protein